MNITENNVLGLIGEYKIIAIIRGVPGKYLHEVLDGMERGGIRCVEIALNSPDALDMIRECKQRGSLLVGAGTAMKREDTLQAIRAGADFVLSPVVSEPMIKACLENGVLPIPGAYTPTEIIGACGMGAELIKVFPAGRYGAAYIRSLLAPLNRLKLLPVGGISAENAADYLRAGAYAIGIGSGLVDLHFTEGKVSEQIDQKCKTLLKTVTLE